jgi:nucleotide-binding universal stress UspA family protein
VVVIPPGVEVPDADGPLVCAAGWSDHGRAVAATANDLAEALHAPLTLVDVDAPGAGGAAAASELIDVARRSDAQLIVAGSRDAGDDRSTLLGAVGSYLARRADRPVMLVPTAAPRLS